MGMAGIKQHKNKGNKESKANTEGKENKESYTNKEKSRKHGG